ncbi:MAG: hypothetical protein Q8R67_12090 [Rhodoferax sp.]|nr:hypothetical protein [Rhodoferax sp.]MDP3652412.1 hypothetical protein [Rhodoferax sp.]
MTALQVIHWVAAFVVMAEALNKLERTAPFAPGLSPHARLVDGLKALAWLLLAMGAGGALIGPFLQPLGIGAQSSQLIAHLSPSLAEVCVLLGFAVLIVRTRVKEG